ncbi:MAG TPA: 2Fe-2S iron-sulfur cluster-binding protein [Allocoleopsis sp.]
MPQITAQGQTFECASGANLRQALLQQGIDLYNGQAKVINCHGIGTCGTCTVMVEGEVSEASWRETARRSLPPHSLAQNRRLACQTQVLGDVKVTKFDGFWGQGTQTVWTPEA